MNSQVILIVTGGLKLEELIQRIKSIELRHRQLSFDNGYMARDINLQLNSIDKLNRQNRQIFAENTELRDLCCFLDD